MITLATAECFTLGKIGTTIHKIASGYEECKNHKYYNIINGNVKIISSSFIPSIEGAEKLLNLKHPLPKCDYEYNYSKAYTEKNDLKVAYMLAKGLKNTLNCNIAIATTAGVGRGGICIISDKNEYLFTTDIEGDLISKKNIIQRQKNGIDKTINKFVEILKKEYFL